MSARPWRSDADQIAEHSQRLAVDLLTEPADLFTAGELLHLFTFINKVRFGTDAATEQRYLDGIVTLTNSVARRKAARPGADE